MDLRLCLRFSDSTRSGAGPRARECRASRGSQAHAQLRSFHAHRPFVAERVAVNARDAGLTVQVSAQNPRADVRLVEMRVESFEPAQALAGIAAALGLEAPRLSASADAGSAATLYEAERKLLEGLRAIPLFQMPASYAAANRVRLFVSPAVTRLGDWRFENVWLSGTAP